MVPARRIGRIVRARAWDTLVDVTASSTQAPSPTLSLRNVVRSFGDERVLDRVTLERSEPGVIGLVGANGAGKTTLLRVVAQLAQPDEGVVEVCGRVIEHADDPTARRLVGWAPHEPLAWRDDSVDRNLRYAARLSGLDRRRAGAVADAAVELWGLRDVADAPVRRLSRGWAQRYSLARAA
jgi:ABC-type multidrug transport system ATPase subunit